jgi:hypothetical protein
MMALLFCFLNEELLRTEFENVCADKKDYELLA